MRNEANRPFFTLSRLVPDRLENLKKKTKNTTKKLISGDSIIYIYSLQILNREILIKHVQDFLTHPCHKGVKSRSNNVNNVIGS